MKVLFINNKDSFVYILVDYVAQLGSEVIVVDNSTSPGEVKRIKPDKIIISPGPGHPSKTTGRVTEIIRSYPTVPMLGVCLGHQAIVEAFGGRVGRAPVGPMHGKVSLIYHDGKTIFRDLANPFEAARYHSLAAIQEMLPETLEVSARAEDGTVMGVRHSKYVIEGVQFHPESILTRDGIKIIANFLKL
ncbi:MAG: aminodeoxychorismate/anthranilate synthase component II [Candidatus Bathyarchaeia archaeon]